MEDSLRRSSGHFEATAFNRVKFYSCKRQGDAKARFDEESADPKAGRDRKTVRCASERGNKRWGEGEKERETGERERFGLAFATWPPMTPKIRKFLPRVCEGSDMFRLGPSLFFVGEGQRLLPRLERATIDRPYPRLDPSLACVCRRWRRPLMWNREMGIYARSPHLRSCYFAFSLPSPATTI